MDGKVIQEHFDDGNGFLGTSISTYVPSRNCWKQNWMDNARGYYDLTGEVVNGKRIFRTATRQINGKYVYQRMAFYNIEKNSFTWDWERTEDDGKTWTLQWRILYTRKK